MTTVAPRPDAAAGRQQHPAALVVDAADGRLLVLPADASALDFTARLHRLALSEGFFPELGHRFLRAYHETFQSSPHGVAFLAWSGDRPVGMLVGTTANRQHYRWVVRHRLPRLGLAAGLALLLRPVLLMRFLRTRSGRYVRALHRFLGVPADRVADAGGRRPVPPQTAVLTHVAVTEEARGRGAGAALVEAFVAAARGAGAVEAQLVTDARAEGNHRFYQRCGWRRRGVRVDSDGQPVSCFARGLA